MRISPEGIVQDSVFIEKPGSAETANDVIVTSDGDIITIGSTTDIDASDGTSALDFFDIYSIRLSQTFIPFTTSAGVGDNFWRRVSGSPSTDIGESLVQNDNGNYIFLATTNRDPEDNSGKEGFNIYTSEVGFDGEAISESDVISGTTNNESASKIIKTETGFSILGFTENGNSDEIYLVRLGSSGARLDEGNLSLGTNVSSSSISESRTGGLLIAGSSTTNLNSDIYMARITLTGQLIWENTFGGLDNDEGKEILELPDGSVVILGTVELESQTKIALIKTNSENELKP